MTGSLEKLHEALSEREELQLVKCASTLQALPILRQVGGGILLMSVIDRNSVVKQVSLLKMLAKLLRRGTVKVLVTSKLKHNGLFSLYQNHGVTELLEEPVHPRTLQIKADRFISRLRGMLRIEDVDGAKDKAGDKKGKRGKKASSKPGGAEGGKRGRDPEWKLGPPLEIESDFWLAKGGSGRRVMGRWMIRLVGPSPTIGRWVEIDGETSGSNRFFQWMPNNPEDQTFLKEEGAWVFYGHKPEFQEDRWVFVGSAPRLSFYYEEQSYGDKLRTDEDGTLVIAADSKRAEQVLEAIFKTFQKVIRAEARKEQEGDFLLEAGAFPDASAAEVVEEDGGGAPAWDDQTGGEPAVEAGGGDFVDRGEDADGELNDLREEDEESAAEWSDERGADPEAADWNDERGEDDEGAAEWGDERGEDEEAADWNDQQEEDEQAEAGSGDGGAPEVIDGPTSPEEIYAGLDEEEEEEDVEPEGEEGPAPDQVISLDKRRKKKQVESEDEEAAESGGAKGSPKLRKAERADAAEKGEDGEAAAEEEEAKSAGASGKSRAAKGAGSPKTRAADGRPRKQFRRSGTDFGESGGDWDFVRELESGMRVYVFVDWNLSSGQVVDAASFEIYWVYEGIDAPEWDATPGEWVFMDRPPLEHQGFEALSRAVQTYLRELEPDDEERELLGSLASEEGGPRPAKGAAPGEDAEEEYDEDDVKVVEILQDAEPRKRGGKKKGAEEDLFESEEDGAEGNEDGGETESEGGFAALMKKRVEALGDAIPKGVAEALESVEDSIRKSGMGAALELAKGKKRRKATEGDLRGSAEEPGLSAMAMAFLLSELLGRVGMDARWAAGRFCLYLANSLGGLRVELWISADRGWERVGSGGGTVEDDPEAGAAAARSNGGAVEGHAGVRRVEGAAVVDVSMGQARLVVLGEDAGKVPAAYLATLAHVLIGLVPALREPGKERAAA